MRHGIHQSGLRNRPKIRNACLHWRHRHCSRNRNARRRQTLRLLGTFLIVGRLQRRQCWENTQVHLRVGLHRFGLRCCLWVARILESLNNFMSSLSLCELPFSQEQPLCQQESALQSLVLKKNNNPLAPACLNSFTTCLDNSSHRSLAGPSWTNSTTKRKDTTMG